MAAANLLIITNELYQLFHLVRLLSGIILVARIKNSIIRLIELRIFIIILWSLPKKSKNWNFPLNPFYIFQFFFSLIRRTT
jgi:hypothetical protein